MQITFFPTSQQEEKNPIKIYIETNEIIKKNYHNFQ